jgi:hypothetical protein
MSTPFTDISSWQHLQDRTAANEIVLAYSERRQCVGDSAIPSLGAGSNAQDTAFWRGIQNWIIDQTTNNKWVDHEKPIAGETTFPFYTLADWKHNSGLYDGFRRATEWPTDWTDYNDSAYSYGPIESGDIRGPWIFEDLHRGLDALRWTNIPKQNVTVDDAQEKGTTTTADENQGSYQKFLNEWDSLDWIDDDFGSTFYFADFSDFEDIITSGRRVRGTLNFSTPDHISHEVKIYYTMKSEPSDPNKYNNCDFPEIGIYYKVDEMALEKTTQRKSFAFYQFEEAPVPSSFSPNFLYIASNDLDSDLRIILEWKFSHVYFEPIQAAAADAQAGDLVEVF